MGSSSTATLFYGYCWDEEGFVPWRKNRDEDDWDEDDELDDWKDRYAKACGLLKPSDRDSEEYSTYWDNRRDLVKQSKCKLGQHCHYDYPMPFVSVEESEIRSYQGEMKSIDRLIIKDDWNDLLEDFCKKMGIDTTGFRLGWWLVSDYG